MALVVFLRGVNVGGHRTLRPTQLAEALTHLGAVNIGAAGTLIIRHRITQAQARAEVARRLPFVSEIVICQGRDIETLYSHARQNRFVIGMYRRGVKGIGYLGALDRLYGVPVTTRNWNTMASIARVLRNECR